MVPVHNELSTNSLDARLSAFKAVSVPSKPQPAFFPLHDGSVSGQSEQMVSPLSTASFPQQLLTLAWLDITCSEDSWLGCWLDTMVSMNYVGTAHIGFNGEQHITDTARGEEKKRTWGGSMKGLVLFCRHNACRWQLPGLSLL